MPITYRNIMMPKSELRTGNVLFIDVVGYSPRTIDQQSRIIETLNRLVRETPAMTNTPVEDRLCLPTGDGLATAFFKDPRSSIYCALELDKLLKDYNSRVPKYRQFELRMGINQGFVYVIKDINQQNNLTGDGINRVQRVMDCGDARHILISQQFADSLANADSTMARLFHPVGEFEVKHGEIIAIANVYDEAHGNPEMPTRKPRVGGTGDEIAPALRITLMVSRPLVGYFRQVDEDKPILVNPPLSLSDAYIQPFPLVGNRLETEALRKAIQKAKAPVDVSVLHGATPRAVIETLSEGDAQLLHLDSHGSQDGSLVFESLYGEARLVEPELLARIIAQRGVGLVVLSSSGLGERVEALREAGVSAVVGMSDTMRQDAAVEFVSRLYRELGKGSSLKAAFEQGCLTVRLMFGSDPKDEGIVLLSAQDEGASLVGSLYREPSTVFRVNSTKPTTVPKRDTSFVGREIWMVKLAKGLADGGVIELHGESGVGKSALAREVAQWHVERGRFPGGVFWVDLALGGSREYVWNVIGTAIVGDRFSGLNLDKRRALLSRYLEENPSLIVLDNMDSMVKDDQLRLWIRSLHPPSALLATTRLDASVGKVEILNELAASEAHELFVERARHGGWNAPMDKENEKMVDDICHLVGYLPLAIILMAPKAIFSLTKLKAEIERSIQTIADPGNILLSGHSKLINACLNVSYELLDSEEAKQLFRRLLVFPDGADDELIKVVCGITNWTSVMAELLRASLVRKEGNQYLFQPLVRKYAAARLRVSGEVDIYKHKASEAQRYYLQSTKIKEELGYKSKVAVSLGQLASMYTDRGNLNTAVRLLAVAHDIFAAVGSANVAQAKDDLEVLKHTVGEEHFDALLREARSHPDAVIREMLNKNRRQTVPE